MSYIDDDYCEECNGLLGTNYDCDTCAIYREDLGIEDMTEESGEDEEDYE